MKDHLCVRGFMAEIVLQKVTGEELKIQGVRESDPQGSERLRQGGEIGPGCYLSPDLGSFLQEE